MRPGSRRVALAAVLAALLAAPLCPRPAAADAALPGVIGDDDREVVDSADPPWTAIGTVNTPRWREVVTCTGTLIDPHVVVTAAHCLFSRVSGRPVPPESVHFRAGLRRDTDAGHSVAACLKIAPGYDADETGTRTPERDLAFVILRDAIDVPVVPVWRGGRLGPDDRLVHAAYGRDRRYLPMVHRGCAARLRSGGLYFTDCDTNHGGSGGPVLVETDGGLALAAVMSRVAPHRYSLAAALAPEEVDIDALKECPSPAAVGMPAAGADAPR